MRSAWVPTSLEPSCSKVVGAHPIATARAQDDILTVLQDHLLLSDDSVAHCCAETYVERAAPTAESAAEARKKVAQVCPELAGRVQLHPPGGILWPPV